MNRSLSFALLASFALAGCPGTSDPGTADAYVAGDAPGAMDAPAPSADAFGADAQLLGDALSLSDAPSLTDAGSSTDDAAIASEDAAASTDDAPACMRPTGIDLTALGSTCRRDRDCPMGMQCLSLSGIVLTQFCGIPCEAADGGECACPEGLMCTTRADKAGEHRECGRP